MEFVELAKYGVFGISAGLIVVIIRIIDNNFKERVNTSREREESARVIAESIKHLTESTDKRNELTEKNIQVSEQIYEYLKIRNGIADKTSTALAHALKKLGVE